MGGKDVGPDKELFGQDFMNEIKRELRIGDDPRLANFQQRLKEFSHFEREILSITSSIFRVCPKDISNTRQIEWLTVNILKPIEKLRNAVSDEGNYHYFNNPASIDAPDFVFDEEFFQSLDELERCVQEKIEDIKLFMVDGKSKNTSIRDNIVEEILDRFEELFPEYASNRKTKIASHIVRICLKQISGTDEDVTHIVKAVHRERAIDARKVQRKSR